MTWTFECTCEEKTVFDRWSEENQTLPGYDEHWTCPECGREWELWIDEAAPGMPFLNRRQITEPETL